MKRNVLLFFAPSLLLAGLASCAPHRAVPTPVSEQEVASLQAMTAMRMASSIATPSSAFSRKGAPSDADLSSIKKAMPVLEAMLEPGREVTSSIEEGAFEIEGKVFQKKETVAFLAQGKEETFHLWYDEATSDASGEIPSESEESLESSDASGEIPEASSEIPDASEESSDATGSIGEALGKKDEEESETFSRKEGYASTDLETFYPFFAESETEVEEGESESGQTFFLQTGDSSFISVEEEFEVEGTETEHSFHYIAQDNGVLSVDFEIEIELEDGQSEIGLEIGETEYVVARVESEDGISYEISLEDDGTVLWTIKKETDDQEGVPPASL